MFFLTQSLRGGLADAVDWLINGTSLVVVVLLLFVALVVNARALSALRPTFVVLAAMDFGTAVSGLFSI